MGVKEFPKVVSVANPLVPRRYTLTELSICGTPANNTTCVDFFSLDQVCLSKLVIKNTNVTLIDNPILSKELQHIEVTGCKYINRQFYELFHTDRGCPTNTLKFVKVDDPVFLTRVLCNTAKIETLVFSGDMSLMLLDNLKAFSDRIVTLVAQDMSIFNFE